MAGAGILASQRFPVIARGKESEKPNVLFIFSDQEREQVPRELLRLPQRERLEQHGIRFTHAFCTTPQCSASRATLMTGLYPHEAGVATNVDNSSLGRALSPDLPCLGNVFRRNGYAAGYLGKWHLGNDKNGLDDFGFSHYRALRGQALGNAAAEWIRSQSSQPWLLTVSFLNPHDIYKTNEALQQNLRDGVTLPENHHDDFKNKPNPQREFRENDQGKVTLSWSEKEWLHYRSYYLDLIEKVDSHLETILNAVEQTGQRQNTIVIYTSDHGDMGGAHQLPFKGPFMYEELLNVPLVISHPQRFSQTVTCDSLVSLVDFVPTICAMAGISWPGKLSGVDLSPLFEHPESDVREEIFAEYFSKQKWINPIRAIRTKEWKYNLYTGGGEELYDLRRDAGEMRNMATHPFYESQLREMQNHLQRWRVMSHDPLW
jgi:choline-sulfatase